MADSEAWRRQRAEELGLVDQGPSFGRRTGGRTAGEVDPMRPPAPAAKGDALAAAPPRATVAPPPQARQTGQRAPQSGATPAAPARPSARPGPAPARPIAPAGGTGTGRWLTAGGLALLLLVAAALGWLARDAMAGRTPRLADGSVPARPAETARPEPAATPSAVPASDSVSGRARSPAASHAAVPGAPAAAAPPVPADPVPVPAPAGIAAPSLLDTDPIVAPSPARSDAPRPTAVARPARAPAARAPAALEPAHRRVETAAADTVDRRRYPAKPVALPGRSFKPSFNCRRATATVTRMVCDDARLAELDRTMAARYRAATHDLDVDTERLLDADQAAFLNARGRCTSAACVADVYERRIDELGAAGQ